MSGRDWRWKIGEAIERIRHRYHHIGRKTGAPFMGLLYPPAAERAVLHEWHAQASGLSPDVDVRTVDVLEVTQRVLADLGAENVVSAMADPMPGSNPRDELGSVWIDATAKAVLGLFDDPPRGKPVVSMERLAALYPAAGPRDVMQRLWDSPDDLLDAPVVVLRYMSPDVPGPVVHVQPSLRTTPSSSISLLAPVPAVSAMPVHGHVPTELASASSQFPSAAQYIAAPMPVALASTVTMTLIPFPVSSAVGSWGILPRSSSTFVWSAITPPPRREESSPSQRLSSHPSVLPPRPVPSPLLPGCPSGCLPMPHR